MLCAAAACAQLMKHLAQRHSRRINGKRGRSGTLWEGRFFSALVPTESYALNCYRYIERNPVKPAMVEHPGEYRWSSYRANAGGPRASLCATPLEADVLNDIRKATRGGYVMGAKRRLRGRPKKKKW